MFDIIIIGAGVIGASIARTLSKYKLNILVIEKNSDVGDETSSANSAIVHSGYDPKPGTLKAKYNVLGNQMFDKLCEELDIEFERIGSLTIATSKEEDDKLIELYNNGLKNGVETEIISKEKLFEIEPFATKKATSALYAKQAGIVNPFELTVALMENAMDNGVMLELNQEVISISYIDNNYNNNNYYYNIKTKDKEYQSKIVINCAGVNSDTIHNMICDDVEEIIPRKGEYYVLDHFNKPYVRHTLFSLPSDKGKGILVSPTTHGNFLIGPSSEFIDSKDDKSTDKVTLENVLESAYRLVDYIPMNYMIRQFSGLRAYHKSNEFVIRDNQKGYIELLGIQSPGLASSPAIAQDIENKVSKYIDLDYNSNYNPYRRKVYRLNKMPIEERNKLIQKDKRFGEIICLCEKISLGEIVDSINRNCGARTIKGVKKRCRPGFGKCQGGFCQPKVLKILAEELGKNPLDINYSNTSSFILKEETKGKNMNKASMTNKKFDLIVIGGGSGGLASAISSYDNGVKNILIIEKDDHLGGILNQCIHNGFGLHEFKEELAGPEYAQRFIDELIHRKSIEYKLNTVVFKINTLDNEDYKFEVECSSSIGYEVLKCKAIIASTGCSERTSGNIAIPGDRPSGIMTAGLAQRYLNIDGYLVGKKVFILGSGDIGLIMARRMVLEGAEVLGVAELMPYSNGLNRNIVQCLNDYNIPLYLSHTVKKVIGKDRLEKVIIAPVDDNLNVIDDESKELEFNVDTLLLSVGLIPLNSLLENVGAKINPKTKGPVVDENYQTTVKGIFACGNSLHVHDLVDYVTEEGRLAGQKVAKYLKNELTNEVEKVDIEVNNGDNVSYVVPMHIGSKSKDISLKFRVKKPLGKCTIIIKNNGEIIRKINKQYLLPAEMEKIKLDLSSAISGVLTVEVMSHE